jgi:esterase FrsA
MFEKEIILKEQLAARCLFQCSPVARKLPANVGNSLLASFAYGFAIFPCLANDARRKAQQNQLECYLKAAPSFPVKFERRILAIPYQGGTVSTPVHLFSVTGQYASAPVLIYTGGVDTYKMGLHAIYVTLAQRLGITILGFDISGTGESTIPLSVKGDELVLGIVNEARKLGNGKVAHLGFSFGGNFSAMTGLSGAVDAAIVLGGPVDKAWGKENAQNLPFGMPGIIGNDMGFDKEPSFRNSWRQCNSSRGVRCSTKQKTLRCSSSTAQTTISSHRRIRSSSKVAPKPKST